MIATDTLSALFTETRRHTEALCEPLETEDYVVQPMEDVSPPKWHLGHTTWFFEEFILKKFAPGYKVFDDDFAFVFNSYYESLGKRVIRAQRGNLSRPSVKMVCQYRQHVTDAIEQICSSREGNPEFRMLMETGIHHEKQHQELLLTDIKYILGNNPLLPAYSGKFREHPEEDGGLGWVSMEEGIYEIGNDGRGFSYDNEHGRHKVYLNSFTMASRLVTNAEYLKFIEDGGYRHFSYWHSDGWQWVRQQQLAAPLYWHEIEGAWHHYTLSGLERLPLAAPVTHLSYYEAYAYAQWAGCRLPTEFEWEACQHLFSWGHRWEWTESAYLPYPGYVKAAGALGEYNGKFMVNQKVLRGGSVATPSHHTRHTYRNFFPPATRWQFTGLRLAN